MRILRQCILFYLGGTAYFILEILWRGRSHSSMFLLGGFCFLGIGAIDRRAKRIPLYAQLLICSALITGLELLTGLLVNRTFQVWDYRQRHHFLGQICIEYSLLWIPVSLLGTLLHRIAHRLVLKKLPQA